MKRARSEEEIISSEKQIISNEPKEKIQKVESEEQKQEKDTVFITEESTLSEQRSEVQIKEIQQITEDKKEAINKKVAEFIEFITGNSREKLSIKGKNSVDAFCNLAIMFIETEEKYEKRYALMYAIIKMFIYMENVFEGNDMLFKVSRNKISEIKDTPQEKLLFLKLARNLASDLFLIMKPNEVKQLFKLVEDFCNCETDCSSLCTMLDTCEDSFAHFGSMPKNQTLLKQRKSGIFFEKPKNQNEEAKEKQEAFKKFAQQTVYFLDKYVSFITKAKVIDESKQIYEANDENYMAACVAFLAASTASRNYTDSYQWFLRIKKRNGIDIQKLSELGDLRLVIAHDVSSLATPKLIIRQADINDYKKVIEAILADIYNMKTNEVNLDMDTYSKKDEQGHSPRATH